MQTEICGENALLQRCEGRHGQRVKAYFGHNKALGWIQHDLLLELIEDIYLIELSTEQRAIKHDVIGGNVGQWAQTAETEGRAGHGDSSMIKSARLLNGFFLSTGIFY